MNVARWSVTTIVSITLVAAVGVALFLAGGGGRQPAIRVTVSTTRGNETAPIVADQCVWYAAVYAASAQSPRGLPSLKPSATDISDGYRRHEAAPQDKYDDMSGKICSPDVTLSVAELPAGPPPYLVIVEARDGYAYYGYSAQEVQAARLATGGVVLSFLLSDFEWPARRQGLEGRPCSPGQPLPPGYVCFLP